MGVAVDSRVEQLSQGVKPHALLCCGTPCLRTKPWHSPWLFLLLLLLWLLPLWRLLLPLWLLLLLLLWL
jgi:hypothetical protein